MTPDWSADPEPVPYANYDDPQSLNLFSYTRNSPLSNVDLDGHGCALYVQTFTWNDGWHPGGVEGYFCNVDQFKNIVQEATQAATDWITQPRDPGCMAGAMATGSQIGMMAGTTLAAAGGVTIPVGSVAGMTFGATAGYVVGFSSCMSGTGAGGGGTTPSAGQVAQAKRVLQKNGKKAVEKGLRTLEKRLAQHEEKIRNATGHTSSMDKEVENFKQLIQAYKDVLK
jgi:hypothetical protein